MKLISRPSYRYRRRTRRDQSLNSLRRLLFRYRSIAPAALSVAVLCVAVLSVAFSLTATPACAQDSLRPSFEVSLPKLEYRTAEFDRAGERIITTSDKTTIVVLSTETGKREIELKASEEIFNARFMRDPDKVMSAGREGFLVWDLESGKAQKISDKTHTRCSQSPMGRYVASAHTGGAIVWNTTTWEVACANAGASNGWVADAVIMPDGQSVATASQRGSGIHIEDILTGKETKHLPGDEETFYTIAPDPHGKWLAATSKDKVQVWDVSQNQLAYTLENRNEYVAAISPTRPWLATATDDHIIEISELGTQKLLLRLLGHLTKPLSVQFDSSGSRVVSCDNEGNILVWDLARDGE